MLSVQRRGTACCSRSFGRLLFHFCLVRLFIQGRFVISRWLKALRRNLALRNGKSASSCEELDQSCADSRANSQSQSCLLGPGGARRCRIETLLMKESRRKLQNRLKVQWIVDVRISRLSAPREPCRGPLPVCHAFSPASLFVFSLFGERFLSAT